MEHPELRQAPRVDCSIGLHLQGEWTFLKARVEDIGRLGARLRVPLKELGLTASTHLSVIARHLDAVLSAEVVAHFRPEMLGSLVQRHLHAVRVSRSCPDEPSVDVGCKFDRPLTRLDAVALGLPIPMEGETVEEAQAGAEGKAPVAREPEPALNTEEGMSAFAEMRWSLIVKKSESELLTRRDNGRTRR